MCTINVPLCTLTSASGCKSFRRGRAVQQKLQTEVAKGLVALDSLTYLWANCTIEVVWMTTTVVNNLVFRGFFEKHKLTGPKFIDWYQQLRIVLSAEDKLNYLEHPIPAAPIPAFAGQQVPPEALAAYAAWFIAGTSSNRERVSRVQAGRTVLSLILVYLRKKYDSFVQNYNMHDMGKMVNELHVMLKLHEQTLPKKDAPALHAIRAGKVYDTGCGTHICIITQGLRGSRKLKQGALSVYMGNGQRAALEAIGSYDLCFPSELVVILRNLHYVPSITRGVISVSRFVVPREGVYEIDLSNSNTNDSYMYVVSNKRAKLNLDSSLLWHCRIGHISKKRIEKLQHDGLLNSTDIKSFEKCVSCMSRKMAWKPYSHQVERSKDLLGLILTDVCGPFRIVSRQGANYFVTFTNDFSRYGYVYLLKHKHEVFKTFKVFQKEVENQLMPYRTPPYTPQHNGVSERRNRTLLDMVRSMMSQTTFPKSFWDYALESAARILNMVPTKKVEKTPYEVWHGHAPMMSYVKVWGYEALFKRDTLTKPDKLEPRSIKCIFVGYPKETLGYSFYYPPENKVFVARNAEFLKDDLITQEASGSLEDIEIIQEDTHPSENTSIHHDKGDQEIDEP
ncbi:retrotransposon protein, putative, ty1-copia subclass [Tanacetum coccineum]|uniref:Retrotransposon protein, putative, ty1-copia subclass n=1 Tax=Tanacetum coccineum TaxID=301880 RepID=A0ABQ5CUR7_9ASTR